MEQLSILLLLVVVEEVLLPLVESATEAVVVLEVLELLLDFL
jgi:hypothetical protein